MASRSVNKVILIGNLGRDAETKFLLAERREDMERTFRILPGEPLQTAYGEDLYNQIFGAANAAPAAATA